MSAARLPKDITPTTFFLDWLPAEFERSFGKAGVAASQQDLTVRVRLEGEGGGTWDLTLRGGHLEVVPQTGGEGETDGSLNSASTTVAIRCSSPEI